VKSTAGSERTDEITKQKQIFFFFFGPDVQHGHENVYKKKWRPGGFSAEADSEEN
jgi:hypothetical protein